MENAKWIDFEVGSFFDGINSYHIFASDKYEKTLIFNTLDKKYNVSLPHADFVKLFLDLSFCLMWKKEHIDDSVLDEVRWKLTFGKETETKEFRGINEYPNDWEKVIAILKKYQIINE